VAILASAFYLEGTSTAARHYLAAPPASGAVVTWQQMALKTGHRPADGCSERS
jgi:hypothetical protein